ncbi:hypothetical protein TWF718_003738 [Orbilia javanica]|uniref:Uncharacterized protein n=1 Tax=Orbilia javanica TaxID=47235 RepID=A0AAN8N5A4_9PEZI
MLSKRILLLLVPCAAFVVAEDTTTGEGDHEAKIEARFTITLSTSWADYPNKPTDLLTDPNAYSPKPTPTTLQTVARQPRDTNAESTATAMAAEKSTDKPGFEEPMEPGLKYASIGQHVLFYGEHSEDDIKALDKVLAQAKDLYSSDDLRCYAPYRTSKYLPGADMTGYLETRILACEDGYSLRYGVHQMGTARSDLCQYVGSTFPGKMQAMIQNGTVETITPHSIEDDKYRLIASSYVRRVAWDIRFGFEKKGCPDRNGKDEEKDEYVKTFTPDEWRKYAEDKPEIIRYDLAELLFHPTKAYPPVHVPTLGQLPAQPTLQLPDPVSTGTQTTEQTPKMVRRDEKQPPAQGAEEDIAPIESIRKKMAAGFLLRGAGLGAEPDPTPDTEPPVGETAAILPPEPTPIPFNPADPMFSDPPTHTLSYIQPA